MFVCGFVSLVESKKNRSKNKHKNTEKQMLWFNAYSLLAQPINNTVCFTTAEVETNKKNPTSMFAQ